MQRFGVVLFLALMVFSIVLSSCGDNAASVGPLASITLAASLTSLNRGQITAVAAQGHDANANAVNTAVISFSSSNPAVASIATNGLLCAGTWDSTTAPLVCTPGPVSSAVITASANGITSNSITVFVHDRVDRLIVTPAQSCAAPNQTVQLTAQAFNGITQIDAVSLGPIKWIAVDTAVATIDDNGLVTAKAEGTTQMVASVSGVTSPAVTFKVAATCP